MTPKSKTFYWFDTETTGTSPARDRILQLASQRTNLELQPIGKPFETLVRFPPETIPDPVALTISRIKPTHCLDNGIEEWMLMQTLTKHLQIPNTTLIGYNNITFDDHFLRYGMYRNLRPPYEHEYKNGNQRLDLLNIVRLTAALRPTGVEWPLVNGEPVFSQGVIAEANGLDTNKLHDALADVNITIELARLIKKSQPKLWQYTIALPNSQYIKNLLDVDRPVIGLHVSPRYSNARYCLAPVLPITHHPTMSNRVIVVDLMSNVDLLLKGTAEDIKESLFTPLESSTEDHDTQDRLGVQVVARNQSSVVAPFATLPKNDTARLKINLDTVQQARDRLLRDENLATKLRQVFQPEAGEATERIAEEALYDGFIPDSDAKQCQEFWQNIELGQAWCRASFDDQRLRDLYLRLKTRMAPEQLSEAARTGYHSFVQQQLSRPERRLDEILAQTRRQLDELPRGDTFDVLQDLHSYLTELSKQYDLDITR